MDVSMNDVVTLAAIVAAYVGVTKSLAVGTKYEALANRIAPVSSLVFAALFLLTPTDVQSKLTMISTVGLTAAGAYSMTRNKTGGGGGTQ